MSTSGPELYRGFIIAPVRTGGYDVINQITGKWVWRPTERSARWWAGTWSRINEIIMNSKPKSPPRKVKVIKVRKLKCLRDTLPETPTRIR